MFYRKKKLDILEEPGVSLYQYLDMRYFQNKLLIRIRNFKLEGESDEIRFGQGCLYSYIKIRGYAFTHYSLYTHTPKDDNLIIS